MSDDPRVERLLDELMESDSTPEQACSSCLELLPVVRDRWRQMCQARAELDAIFPPAMEPGESLPAFPERDPSALPVIPGYEVEGVLGRGGMGVVFRARQVSLNRPVALKMVLAGAYAGPAERACLLREAETVAALRHPHIVPVYDVGEADGRPYFTMELVDGGSLAQRLTGAPLPAKEAAALVATVADAIEAAHRAGVVHRDLKPANVLLSADGTPKVADFSLARRLEGPLLSQSGAAVGTPSYMSPEQAGGRSHTVGPATDVYALGAMLYELLTGRPPFRAESVAETVLQVVSQEPVPPSRLNATVPRDLETICLKCLEKSPAARFATAGALADDLRRFQRGEPVTARSVGRPERVVRWARRKPTAAALVVTAFLLLVVGVLLGLREWERVVRLRAESARWGDRLAVVTDLQQDGRFSEARAILTQTHAEDSDLARQVDEARGRLDLVERLDAIRLGRKRDPKGTGLDYAASSRQYAEVFRSAGLGGVGEDPAGVAARLDVSPVRKALIAALDDWAACAEQKERDWVLVVCRTLDPDPWRDRVRDADGWANTDAFPEIVADADISHQPVTLMVAFGTRWRRLGGDPTDFLERVQRQYPTDFWVNFELGHLLRTRDMMAAVGYLRAALAVRPGAAVVHFHLADYSVLLGQFDAAVHHYKRGLEHDPGAVKVRNFLGTLLRNRGSHGEAIAQWRTSLEFEPNQPEVWQLIRAAQAEKGRLEDAADEWRQLLARGERAHADWDGYAELCLYLGREEEYHNACRELLGRFGSDPDLQVGERTGRACLLAPGTPDELRRTVAVVDRVMGGDWKRLPAWVPPYLWFLKGLAEYRQDRLDSAITIMRDKAASALGPAPRLVIAMAEYRLGRKADARKTLAEALESFDWEPTKANTRERWMYHVLRREAERVITAN